MKNSLVSSRLRWGVLSTARITRALLAPLSQSPRSELVAVASRDLATARAFADSHGIPAAYGSYEELLAQTDIDAVYIPLPNHLHCEWTVAAAQSGKHVLCEKPLVLSLEQMDRVEAAASDHNVTIFEAFMYLHHPQTRRLRAMVREGDLGQLQSVRSHFSFHLSPKSNNVRLNPEMSGGSLWDVGVYPVSFSIVMAGAGVPVEVSAVQRIGETGIDVTFDGQMRFSNDVAAQVSCGFRRPLALGATLAGSNLILDIDEPWKPGFAGKVSTVSIRSHEGDQQPLTFSRPDPYFCEVAAMEACVLDGADPVVPLSLSRQFLRTVLALYQAAKTGRLIKPRPD